MSSALFSSQTDPEELFTCPYDPNHQIRRCKIIVHINKCRKNNPVAIKNSRKTRTCPFDATHVVPAVELELHKRICPANTIHQDIIHENELHERVVDMPIRNHNIVSSENWDCEETESAPFILNGNPMMRLPRQPPVATSCVNQTISSPMPAAAAAPVAVQHVRLAGAGRGQSRLNGPPSGQRPSGICQTAPRTATSSIAFNASMLSGKATQVNDERIPQDHRNDSQKLSVEHASPCAAEFDPEKEERKLRKKLKAIDLLEKDRASGKQLNDDQLQKLASRDAVQEQLRNLRV